MIKQLYVSVRVISSENVFTSVVQFDTVIKTIRLNQTDNLLYTILNTFQMFAFIPTRIT